MKDFVKTLVGEEAGDILRKAADSSPILKQNLISYLCLSWVNSIVGWNGEIPGFGGTLVITKSEDSCNGFIELKDKAHYFDDMNKTEVAALLSLYVSGSSPEFRFDFDKGRTYDNIDKLVKYRMEFSLRKNLEQKGVPQAPKKDKPTLPMKQPQFVPAKADLTMVSGEKPKKTARKSETKIKLTKADMSASCPECGDRFFDGEKFTGCFCIKDIVKSEKHTLTPLGPSLYSLSIKGMEDDQLLLIFSSLKGK